MFLFIRQGDILTLPAGPRSPSAPNSNRGFRGCLQYTDATHNRVASTLIIRDAVAKDLIISHRVAPLEAAIGGVALDGVNSAVFHLFHDTYMIGISILSIFIIPVKEDNHAGTGFKAVADPLSPVFEPIHTVNTAGEFGDDTGTDIAALISTPAYKAGTPFHPFCKSVPTPIGFTAYVTNLGSCHFHNQL